MSTYVPIDVQAGLDAARKSALKRSSRLRIEAGHDSYAVLRAWEDGLALDAETTPHLRGRVALYDGARLLSHGLIIASEEEHGEIRFDFKRVSDAHDNQPLDFYRAPDAPVALIAHS
ncbi:MAG: hypothetical protein AB8B82_03615 [Roseovarius sp.]